MADGYLTTHVLDTARGCPAAGMRIVLYRVSGNSHRKIAEAVTNADGRTDGPILPTKDLAIESTTSGTAFPTKLMSKPFFNFLLIPIKYYSDKY